MMAFFEIVAELFIRFIWEGILNFVGACVRFLFSKKKFEELRKDELSAFAGVVFVVIVIVLVLK